MEPKDLKDFLKSLKDTDIEELELESGDVSVYLKKADAPQVVIAPPAVETKKAVNTVQPIKSGMVGTFYNSQSKTHPPFVIEGTNVTPGQKVGSVEAMKIMKDVTSNVKGKIVKILVLNGQTVEYGQDLFLVDTAQ